MKNILNYIDDYVDEDIYQPSKQKMNNIKKQFNEELNKDYIKKHKNKKHI